MGKKVGTASGGGRYRGYIVNCDVVGFSKKSQREQERVAQHLESAAHAALNNVGPHAKHRFICTGDGFYLCVHDPQVYLQPSKLLVFLREIQAACANEYQLRAGIHAGDFAHVHLYGSPNAIGDGLNTTARLAALGDPGHVLVSAEINSDLQKEGATGFSTELCGFKRVKHQVVLQVFRVFDTTFGNKHLPRSFQRDLIAQKGLLAHLEDLYEVFADVFKQETRLSQAQLGMRLSLLFPDASREFLHVTAFRVDPVGQLIEPSKARFPIGGNREVEFAGFAYRDRQPKFIRRLPRRDDDPEAYVAALNRAGCQLQTKDVLEWRKPARAFWAIPIDLQVEGEIAILSVDFAADMKAISKELLNGFFEALQLGPGYLPLMASLIQLTRV